MYRAIYVGTCDAPKRGELGHVFKAGGYDDPDSTEYLAWLFEPDSEKGEGAYYIDRLDWEHAKEPRCPICGSLHCKSPNCGSRY